MYVSLKRSHPFWSYKGTFLYITYLLQALYMTQLFHLHWTNHINAKYSKSKISQNTTNLYSIILKNINVMKSSNKEPHYILSWPSDINSLYRSDILLITFVQIPTNHIIPSM